jgi:hypothetical protein
MDVKYNPSNPVISPYELLELADLPPIPQKPRQPESSQAPEGQGSAESDQESLSKSKVSP